MKFFNDFFAFIAAAVAAVIFYISLNDSGASASDPYLGGVIAFIVTYLVVWGYCVPMLIAQHRQHPQLVPIIILNVVGGWSGILWLVALVWSVYNPNPSLNPEANELGVKSNLAHFFKITQ